MEIKYLGMGTGFIDLYYNNRRYNFEFLKGSGKIMIVPEENHVNIYHFQVHGPVPVSIKAEVVDGKPHTLINGVHIEDLIQKTESKELG